MNIADIYKAKALGLENGSGGGGGDYLELSGGTMSGDINMDGNAVTGIGTPTNAGDATPKGYVDDKIHENKEAFVAVYEQTAYADVIAAIAANKVIVIDMPANNNQFCMTYSTYTNGGNALMYAIYKMNDRPTLMTATLTPADHWTIAHTDLQDKLVSGTSIKTINNQSLLGSGNLDVGGGTVDSAMSDTSENAVQNKVIKAYVDQKAEIGTSGGGGTDPLNASVSNASDSIQFAEQTYGNVYFQIAADSVDPFSTTLASRDFVEKNLGNLSDLTTDEKTNLVGAINEVYEKSGEPFRVKNWASSTLNVQVPACTEDIENTDIPKMDFTISDAEGADYQVVGMIAYELKDASGNRISCWPVCQFTGNGQKTLTLRWAGMGTTRKTATRINAWVLLKHR